MTDSLSTIAPPQREGTDDRIRRAVMLLATATGATTADMCRVTGLARSTFYTRLSEDPERRRSFQPDELAALADLFDVDVSVLFHGVTLEPARGRRRARLVPQVLTRPWRGVLLPGR